MTCSCLSRRHLVQVLGESAEVIRINEHFEQQNGDKWQYGE